MPERPAWYHPARWSHLSRWKLFFGLWAILLGLSVAVTAIGSLLAGGLQEWHALMTRLTPWWVVWRLGLYLVIGGALLAPPGDPGSWSQWHATKMAAPPRGTGWAAVNGLL
ncbi:hypothetical protein NR756_19550 [Alloalcanivorax xenomutans]|uniref:hypothetical protein n=1 Tax=Alloalcanivorax xenomutans TaxID=1094342 RepID=UPI003A7FE16A